MSTALAILRHVRLARAASPRTRLGAAVALGAACIPVAACSSGNPQPPDVFIAATMNESTGLPGLCPVAPPQTQWLDVGVAMSGSKPVTVQNGNQSSGATVQVTCTVKAVGNGFDIVLSVSQAGLQGGSVTITSPSGQGAITQSGGTVSGTFESQEDGAFRDLTCTITPTYLGAPVPILPAVAPGRIWGHLSCPDAQIADQPATGPDGGPTEKTCDGEADFLFERCGS